MDPLLFRHQLLAWYADHKRDLPWRNTQDPYPIWLSEIILQQTRVAQGMPYWHAFMEAYPTVEALAEASEEEVLRLWQGLGYYSRARNLHACARQVVNEYGGIFPKSYNELLTLKGIGKYTAAAIASFAFDEAVPVVDGNVFRLYARVFGIYTDISSSKAFNEFFELGKKLIDPTHAADYNQASMEFGATYCKPQQPPCLTCTFSAGCYALSEGKQRELPVKIKKTKVRDRHFQFFVIEHQGKVLMRPRPEGDIWTGLYEFYLMETRTAISTPEPDFVSPENQVVLGEMAGPYKHILSHQRLHAHFIKVNVVDTSVFQAIATKLNLRAVNVDELDSIPKPKLMLRYLADHPLD